MFCYSKLTQVHEKLNRILEDVMFILEKTSNLERNSKLNEKTQGKNSKFKEKTQNSRKKLKNSRKNSKLKVKTQFFGIFKISGW